MTDINRWIDEQIAAGQSTSDLAAIVSDLLNKKDKEIAAARKADRERDDLLESYFDSILADLDTDNLNYDTAARIAAIVWVRKNPTATKTEINRMEIAFSKALAEARPAIQIPANPKMNITMQPVNTPEEAYKAIERFLFNNGIK